MLLSSDTEVGLATASVTIPAGWELDISSSSLRTPAASRGGVDVTVSDAVWLGDSDKLLTQVSALLFDGDADVPVVSDDAEGSEGSDSSRELWHLAPSEAGAEGVPARVDVIREGEGVVLVVARGAQSDVEAQSEAIDAISDSVQLDLASLNVEAGT